MLINLVKCYFLLLSLVCSCQSAPTDGLEGKEITRSEITHNNSSQDGKVPISSNSSQVPFLPDMPHLRYDPEMSARFAANMKPRRARTRRPGTTTTATTTTTTTTSTTSKPDESSSANTNSITKPTTEKPIEISSPTPNTKNETADDNLNDRIPEEEGKDNNNTTLPGDGQGGKNSTYEDSTEDESNSTSVSELKSEEEEADGGEDTSTGEDTDESNSQMSDDKKPIRKSESKPGGDIRGTDKGDRNRKMFPSDNETGTSKEDNVPDINIGDTMLNSSESDEDNRDIKAKLKTMDKPACKYLHKNKNRKNLRMNSKPYKTSSEEKDYDSYEYIEDEWLEDVLKLQNYRN